MKRIGKRLKSAEIAQGYPGFAYHNATTEDLTQNLNRFVIRPIKEHPGHWQVTAYHCAEIPTAMFNKRPRTRFGRWFKGWDR